VRICGTVAWYNAEGMAGLEDAQRPGRPPKLNAAQLASLKARVSAPPEVGTKTAWGAGAQRMCNA